MRRHTIIGDELLLAAPPLRAVAPLVRASHERWDGGGYPDGVAGAAIPLAARIVAACDAYDAMTTDRIYRRAMRAADARAELDACAGSQFDPAVVAALQAELLEPHRHHPMADAVSEAASRHAPRESGALAAFARLHSQLDAASSIESADELPRALETVAAAVAETLGFDAVVVNLYRKAWDDFIVSTVHGDESLRAALLGATYSWEDWESMLSERFRHGGAYLVYDGEIDWDQQSGKRIVADIETIDAPDAWRAEDEIFVPFHHADGTMLGILNVGSPTSGIRPSDEDLEVLTLVVRHAARAVQRAQDAANDAAHRRGLEELLRVSSKLSETVSPSAVLQAICSGISQGLGFERVLVQLRAEDSDMLVSAAGVGIETDDVSTRFVLHDADLERLLDPAFETQGCYLLPLEQAKRRVPSYHDTFPSVANGCGPAAWDRHWLVVPLVDRTGARLGAVFADDPADRLLPTRERLQALRLFANQATSALESSAQYETMRYLADRDPLTKLLNRRAFVRHLEDAAGRARVSRPAALAPVLRPGRLQDGERHPRPRRGRPRAVRVRPAARRDRPPRRRRLPDGRRRVRARARALLARARARGRRPRRRAPARRARDGRAADRGELRGRGRGLLGAGRQRGAAAPRRRRDVRREGLPRGAASGGLSGRRPTESADPPRRIRPLLSLGRTRGRSGRPRRRGSRPRPRARRPSRTPR